MPSDQFFFDPFAELWRSQQPLVRGQGFSIIHLFYLGANARFGNKLNVRHEVVEQEAQGPVDRSQRVPFGGSGEAVIADKVPDAGAVLLLDIAVVVLAVRSKVVELIGTVLR